jgi:hypothetical protein
MQIVDAHIISGVFWITTLVRMHTFEKDGAFGTTCINPACPGAALITYKEIDQRALEE